MTQFSSEAATTPRPSSILSRPVLDARLLDAEIGRRRAALAALVAEMMSIGVEY